VTPNREMASPCAGDGRLALKYLATIRQQSIKQSGATLLSEIRGADQVHVGISGDSTPWKLLPLG